MSNSFRNFLAIIGFGILLMIALDLLKNDYSGPTFIEDPIQEEIRRKPIIKEVKGVTYTITPLASYEIQAGVQSVEHYQLDATSDISPVDLVLAWGGLNSEEMEKVVSYNQSSRWYRFTYKTDGPASLAYISEHSSNTHIIPSDELIWKAIVKVKIGDFVTMKGYLVSVQFNGGSWTSSLTRKDTGDGACEVFYVTDLSVK